MHYHKPLLWLTIATLILATFAIEPCHAQKWRANARPRTAAERFLTTDTFAIVSIHPAQTLAAPWFQQMPDQWTRGYSAFVRHATLIEASTNDLAHMLVLLEPFSTDELMAWAGNGQKPWHGRVTEYKDNSIGAPAFLGVLLTFSSDEAAAKCYARVQKFGEAKKIGNYEVTKGKWGSSPVCVHQNGRELLVANEARIGRMLDADNTNSKMKGFIKHVWRPYQEFALLLPETMTTSIAESISSLVPAKRDELRDLISKTGSMRLEFKPNEAFYIDWRAKQTENQAAFSKAIQAYCQNAPETIDTSIPEDYVNFDIYYGMGNRILKHLLSNLSFEDRRKEASYSSAKHPRSIRAVVGEVPAILGHSENLAKLRQRARTGGNKKNSRTVRSGKKRVAPRANQKMASKAEDFPNRNREATETAAFRTYTAAKNWHVSTAYLDGESIPALTLRSVSLTDKDCDVLANSKTIQSLNLDNVTVSPANLKKLFSIPTLNRIWLEGENFGDQHMEACKELSKLKQITIHSCETITDTGIGYLNRNRSLEQISLSGLDGVTATGLNRLLNQPKLTQFVLIVGQMDETSFQKLGACKELKKVQLILADGLTDKAVSHLTKLEKLVELEIDPAYGEDGLTTKGVMALVKKRVPERFKFPEELLDDQLLEHLVKNNWLHGPVSDSSTRKPATAADVQSISIGSNEITDKGFEQYLSCTNANYLSLAKSKITDASLLKMSDFKQLDWVSISGTNVTAKGLAALKNAPIERLSLNDNQLSEEFFKLVGGEFKKLKYLDISSCKFQMEWLKHLSKNVTLQDVTSYNTGLTDDGLAHLAKIPNLTELQLNNNKLTVAGLESLKAHTHLKKVYVGSNQITDEELVEFNKTNSALGVRK